MVRTRSNLSIKKKNGSRKIKKGGAKPGEQEKQLQSAIDQKITYGDRLIQDPDITGLAAAGATLTATGAAVALTSTTLLTAGIADGAISAGTWIGGGALLGIGGSIAGPIVTAITASMAVGYATYSVARKNKLKSRIRHFIKRQMLSTLDEMDKNSKNYPERYPELQGYRDNENRVKKFFVDYGIFANLADIFMSLQSSMLHFYPSERLMYPIHFDTPTKDTKIPWKENNLGKEFLCFYDYLTSDEHLYFTSSSLNNGTTTSFLRLKLKSETWYTHTPDQIITDLKLQLQNATEGEQAAAARGLVGGAPLVGGEVERGAVLAGAAPIGGVAEPNASRFAGYTEPKNEPRAGSIIVTVPALPTLSIGPIQTREEEPTNNLIQHPKDNLIQPPKNNLTQTSNKEKFSFVKYMQTAKKIDFLKVNNTDNTKASVDVTKTTDEEYWFAVSVLSLLQNREFVTVISDKIKDFTSKYEVDFTEEADKEYKGKPTGGGELITTDEGQTGGAIFTRSMSSPSVIKGSKNKLGQSVRTKKYSESDKHSFVEFIYYSTYSFYSVFSDKLHVREVELEKFFNDYVGDLMKMLKKGFSAVVNGSSIYIAIARALAITFEQKLGTAFNNDGKTEASIDFNSKSTLNETEAIEARLKADKLFSSDSFFNLKNSQIRNYIFNTYADISKLESAMNKTTLGSRQQGVASHLDSRFTREIFGRDPVKQEFIESQQVRTALAEIFGGKFGMFKNILANIDTAIDDFDGVATQEFQKNLQRQLPKLAQIGKEGMTFTLPEGLVKVNENDKSMVQTQIAQKKEELKKLEEKQEAIAKITA